MSVAPRTAELAEYPTTDPIANARAANASRKRNEEKQ